MFLVDTPAWIEVFRKPSYATLSNGSAVRDHRPIERRLPDRRLRNPARSHGVAHGSRFHIAGTGVFPEGTPDSP
jgi:hypothetical protein